MNRTQNCKHRTTSAFGKQRAQVAGTDQPHKKGFLSEAARFCPPSSEKARLPPQTRRKDCGASNNLLLAILFLPPVIRVTILAKKTQKAVRASCDKGFLLPTGDVLRWQSGGRDRAELLNQATPAPACVRDKPHGAV